MVTLIVAVLAAVVISAFCSLSEAALYSVPWSWIERLRKDGRASGELLFSLRTNVEKPITAILTLNTIANTAGAAIAGAAGAAVFGAEDLWLFTAIFTVLILAFGEILPKTMGVAYSRPISVCIARPMKVLILALLPIIWAGGLLARLVAGKKKDPLSSEEDLRAVVSLTRREGVIKPLEELSIKNILSLDRKLASDIMTPRTVVFSLPAQMTVAEARGVGRGVWRPHSRHFRFNDRRRIAGKIVVGIPSIRREVSWRPWPTTRTDVRLGDLMEAGCASVLEHYGPVGSGVFGKIP